ncbi:alpha/beta fold hydrolase [Skermania piniformis]|uniref:Lysophospholipase n=1 Tax=Skermania pinensis TaxID=39122 RepID=A0ABX8S7N4_9ACTN|nr:alpha/beta fold hydrolase [Skermania piniformis]QXQ13024.1 lysophospholipase [Skermania piniformis]
MRYLWTDAAVGPGVRGIVAFFHGGAEFGRRPVDLRSLPLLRTRLLRAAAHPRLAGAGLGTALLRFGITGWNGADASPVADARWALDDLDRRAPSCPIAIVGHSMGARAALHVADHPNVRGVLGLAPWFPPDDDVRAVRGKPLVAAHGRQDRVTSPRATRRLLYRAESTGAQARFVDMGPAGHYMLRRHRSWIDVVCTETTAMLDEPG